LVQDALYGGHEKLPGVIYGHDDGYERLIFHIASAPT
jgi:hypothetical protein